MHKTWLLPTILATCLTLSSGAWAQSALDRDTIQRWINAAQDLNTWAETNDTGEFGEELLDGDGMPDFSDMEGLYRDMYAMNAEVQRIINRQGFRSAEQWGDVSARIIMGMIAMEMEGAQPEIDAQMAAAMRELEQNPNIPPQQREMMRQQMQQAMGMMGQVEEYARPQDLPALRAMREELRGVIEFGSDDDDW